MIYFLLGTFLYIGMGWGACLVLRPDKWWEALWIILFGPLVFLLLLIFP